MEATTHDNNDKDDRYNLSILFLENSTYYYGNMTSLISDISWLIILLDRSQQVMTIVGVIANIGTSITLIKNVQVSINSNNKWIYWCNRCQKLLNWVTSESLLMCA